MRTNIFQKNIIIIHFIQGGDEIYPKVMRSGSSMSGSGGHGKLEEVVYPKFIATSGTKYLFYKAKVFYVYVLSHCFFVFEHKKLLETLLCIY